MNLPAKLARTAAAGLIALGLLANFAANAGIHTSFIGESAAATAASRTIVIDADTHWVNVIHGETVKFVVNGKAFAVSFNGVVSDNSNLQELAPAGVLNRRVNVAVRPNGFDAAR